MSYPNLSLPNPEAQYCSVDQGQSKYVILCKALAVAAYYDIAYIDGDASTISFNALVVRRITAALTYVKTLSTESIAVANALSASARGQRSGLSWWVFVSDAPYVCIASSGIRICRAATNGAETAQRIAAALNFVRGMEIEDMEA